LKHNTIYHQTVSWQMVLS